MGDSDAASTLLKMAQQWIELAEESLAARSNKEPVELHPLAVSSVSLT
jgi:hypothetical protein